MKLYIFSWNFFLALCAHVQYSISIMENKLLFTDGRLTVDGANQLLKPYYPLIMQCIVGGWNAWEELQQLAPKACSPLLPRTRAGVIHDNIEEKARRTFGDRKPDIMLYSNRGFLIIDFHGKIMMRFKKLSSDFL